MSKILEMINNNPELKKGLDDVIENLQDEFNNTDDTDALSLCNCFELSSFIHSLQDIGIINFFYEEVRKNDDDCCYDSIIILPYELNGLGFNKLIEIQDIDSIRCFLQFEEPTKENLIKAIEYYDFMASEFMKKFNFKP